ncbi:YidC/Oxa1 family membrane protein insertase [Spirillospora sp. CA-294931]|uniref:YidC/Oxa1 family membrane protein insertase n=1 Tax=Spirillospora sp. CA-294931 TaxID=3240042 RepID=UPI003D8D7C7C
MFLIDTPVSAAHDLVSALASTLEPVAGGLATAGAIIVFTVAVRLLLSPLAVAQARGERARAALMPKMRALHARHAKNPERLRRELADLYASEGASPMAGCLPSLAQLPFFFVMYRLFVSASVAGHPNLLLAHTLFGAPLGQNLIGVLGAGLFSGPALVFLVLLALLATVAWWTSRRLTVEGPLKPFVRLLPFATVAFAAFVPLAAALYLLTTTTWTALERTILQRPATA